jgi:hypothetical protein
MIVLLYFCCFVLKYQSVKELLRAHVCHVDLYILLPTLNKIYLLTYLLKYWRNQGLKIIMYLDDGLGGANDFFRQKGQTHISELAYLN